MSRKTINLVSLGCARNRVDTEIMMGRIVSAGYDITENPSEADIIIINTCSFITSAVDESIDTILEFSRYKKTGKCSRLIVAGCLPERFREELVTSIPEADFFLGTGAYDRIVDVMERNPEETGFPCLLPNPENAPLQKNESPRVRTSFYSAYIKIAEGCNKKCTFCMIPRLRGGLRSRDELDIVSEVLSLKNSGIKELTLVAQDTTCYGVDRASSGRLDSLLETLADAAGDLWLRVLYGHPESINEEIIKTIARHQNICSYFDIPVQHASDSVLRRMGRNYTQDDLRRLFDTIRSIIPDAALRTTAMVGFPGETAEDFEDLVRFAKDIRFDHLGVFVYSDADTIPSHGLKDHVDKILAKERFNRLMSCQSDISFEINRKHIGKIYEVLVEDETDKGHYIGRTRFQAPEADGITYVSSNEIEKGSFAMVKITDAFEYDLSGDAV